MRAFDASRAGAAVAGATAGAAPATWVATARCGTGYPRTRGVLTPCTALSGAESGTRTHRHRVALEPRSRGAPGARVNADNSNATRTRLLWGASATHRPAARLSWDESPKRRTERHDPDDAPEANPCKTRARLRVSVRVHPAMPCPSSTEPTPEPGPSPDHPTYGGRDRERPLGNEGWGSPAREALAGFAPPSGSRLTTGRGRPDPALYHPTTTTTPRPAHVLQGNPPPRPRQPQLATVDTVACERALPGPAHRFASRARLPTRPARRDRRTPSRRPWPAPDRVPAPARRYPPPCPHKTRGQRRPATDRLPRPRRNPCSRPRLHRPTGRRLPSRLGARLVGSAKPCKPSKQCASILQR